VWKLAQLRTSIILREAVLRAEIPRRSSPRRGLEKGCNNSACGLLGELFSNMPMNAQREFIASRLGVLPEATIEVALAERRVGNAGMHPAGAQCNVSVFAKNALAMWCAGLAVLPIGPDRRPV
jgi:hypothetical protein